MEKRLTVLCSAVCSAIITVIFITAITIAADLLPPLKDWLKATFTHHWIGKSILATLLFVLGIVTLPFLKKGQDIEKITKKLNLLFWLGVLGSILITGFFIWEAFLKR